MRCNIFGGSKIGKSVQLCGRAHYHATRKNLHCKTHLDEPLSESEELQSWGCSKILLSFLVRLNQLRHRVPPWMCLHALRLSKRYQLIHTVRQCIMTASRILSVVSIMSVRLGTVVREFKMPWSFLTPPQPQPTKNPHYRYSYRHWQETSLTISSRIDDYHLTRHVK
jgi:hypothetical protein